MHECMCVCQCVHVCAVVCAHVCECCVCVLSTITSAQQDVVGLIPTRKDSLASQGQPACLPLPRVKLQRVGMTSQLKALGWVRLQPLCPCVHMVGHVAGHGSDQV